MGATDLLIIPITYLGVIAGAISGVIEARRKDMDIVGACTVAFITALGGGTLRDILLGRLPVFWVHEESFALWAFGAAVITYYLARFLPLSPDIITLPDALGLGVFSILGTRYALQANVSPFVAALMGITTGVFGGILRDVICNEIPNVFARSAQLYATCSFLGAWVYIFLINLQVTQSTASLIGILTVFLLRMAAVRYNLRLPDV